MAFGSALNANRPAAPFCQGKDGLRGGGDSSYQSPQKAVFSTKHLGQAVNGRRRDGLDCSSDRLAHISPLGWAHILLTGEYRWPKK